MSNETHRGGISIAGIVAALVILGLVAFLFATLAKESVVSTALLMLPLTLYSLWAVVFYNTDSD